VPGFFIDQRGGFMERLLLGRVKINMLNQINSLNHKGKSEQIII
jgi:hypothetical protein